MMVAQYVIKFKEISRYVPTLIVEERAQARNLKIESEVKSTNW